MPEVHHLHHHLHHLHWTQAGLQQQFINNNLKSIKKHRLTRQKEERGVRPDVQAFEFGQLLIYRHPQQSNWLFTSGKCLRINRRNNKMPWLWWVRFFVPDMIHYTRHHYIIFFIFSCGGTVGMGGSGGRQVASTDAHLLRWASGGGQWGSAKYNSSCICQNWKLHLFKLQSVFAQMRFRWHLVRIIKSEQSKECQN